MALKRSRSNPENPKVIKKWEGPQVQFGELLMTLPENHWIKNIDHSPSSAWIDFKCYACGQIHSIKGPNSTVRDDGLVEPLFIPGGFCGLQEWLQLDKWEPGIKKKK